MLEVGIALGALALSVISFAFGQVLHIKKTARSAGATEADIIAQLGNIIKTVEGIEKKTTEIEKQVTEFNVALINQRLNSNEARIKVLEVDLKSLYKEKRQ